MIINKELLLRRLNKTKYDENEYKVTPSKFDGFTVLCRNGGVDTYINSRYNPVKSGEQFAGSVLGTESELVVYGLGLGYHIRALAEMLSPSQRLYVFETSYVLTKIAFEKTDIAETLEKNNIVFICTDELKEIAGQIDELINVKGGRLIIYEPSLSVIPKEMDRLRDALAEYKALQDMRPVFSDRMRENFETNTSEGYSNGVRLFKGAFKGLPAIIVAAGASLGLNVADMKACTGKAVVISVTRAATTLFSAGVEPDFYIATDAGSYLHRHLNYAAGKLEKPLFLLATADSAAKRYQGEKFVIYERGSAPPEEKDYTVETGGSVATAAVSLCANLGANPIVFIGQDLCYCLEKDHSDGKGRQMLPLKASKSVVANDGNSYFTSGSLYIYLRWIERFIKRNNSISFFNATALGAVIDGAPNINLLRFFEKYSDISFEKESIIKSRGGR